MVRIALYPGSFDPITNGHLDVIKRSLSLFDKIIIAVNENPLKDFLFTAEERVEMIKRVLNDFPEIEVESFRGLLVHYAKKKGARFIIRGLNPQIETVYLMTDQRYSYLSSSVVKEIAKLGGCTRDLVPDLVGKRLSEKFEEEWNAN